MNQRNGFLILHVDTDGRRFAWWVGISAVLFSCIYFLSDVIEAIQGGFSGAQLALTLVGEVAVPFVVIGLYLAQRPKIGRLGLISAIAYAYSYVFFSGTVVYALVKSTSNYAELVGDLGVAMTVHGGIMVFAGIGLGIGVVRARVVPRWTGLALMVGVVAVAATQTSPEGVALAAAGIRAAAFAGMGFALLSAPDRPKSVRAEDG